jgi:hypothetical protein
MSTKACTALTERLAIAGASWARRIAWANDVRSRAASASIAASARSPIPRFGSLMIRRSDTVSSGFTSTRRYASASRTSLRS